MRALKSIYCIIFLVVFLGTAHGMTSYSSFCNLSLNGASTICSVAEDGNGIIWLGTENGLFSYDGYHSFAHHDKKGNANCRIHSIVENGKCLFLGAENGLYRYEILSGEFSKVGDPHLRDIRAMMKWKDKLILGCASGLFEYSPKNGQCRRVALKNHTVYSLLQTPNSLLVGTLNGLFVIDSKGKVKPMLLEKGTQPLVNSLAYDRFRHCYWIGAEGALYKTDLKSLTPIPALARNSVKSLMVNRDGRLLIGTDDGLFVYKSNSDVARVVHDAIRSNSLTNNIVWTLFADRKQNVWIGTDNGLSLSAGSSYFSYSPVVDITKSGDGNFLHAIFRDRNGMMWIGGTNGLIRYGETSNGYGDMNWYRQNSTVNNLSHNRVRKVYQDADGDIWVATDHGINFYDRQRKEFRNFIVTDKSKRYSCNWAYDILLDSGKRLWIAAYMGGIFIIDKYKLLSSGGITVADRHIAAGRNGLQGIHIGQMAMDGRGFIWAMPYGRGLDRIDPKTFRVRHLLDNKTLSYIMTDERGSLWAGYDGGVVNIPLNKTAPVFHPFSDGITPSRVTTMVSACGNIWVFSGNVCRVLNSHNTFTHFKVPDVSAITSFYSHQNDNIYIGGNDGLVSISPSKIKKLASLRSPSLVSMFVNGTEYQDAKGNFVHGEKVRLSCDENNISFRFSDLPYSNLPQAVYVYKLEGSDHEWRYINDFNEEITYNGLRHGNYTMIVRNVDDIKEVSAYSLSITIRAPWYLSYWAYLIYIVLALLFIWWIMNFYAVKKNLSLERIARRRIMDQSQARANFFASLSEKLKRPLSHILAPTTNFMTNNEPNATMEEIWKNAKAMNSLIYQSLDTDGEYIERVESSDLASVNIVDYLRLGISYHEETSAGGNLPHITLNSDVTALNMDIDIVRFDITISEIINYIDRHTVAESETIIALNSDIEKRTLSIRIYNEKFHINESERNMLFQRYPLSDNTEDDRLMGFFVVRKYVERCQGTMSFHNVPATKQQYFSLMFPLDKKASIGVFEEKSTFVDKLFAEATAIIENHINDASFNVTSLQTELGVGGKLLYRRIKSISGMTPVEYIRNIRMKKAALLLREGKYSISEVMFMVGFSNSGYFSKCFQRTFGVTPTGYVMKGKE